MVLLAGILTGGVAVRGTKAIIAAAVVKKVTMSVTIKDNVRLMKMAIA